MNEHTQSGIYGLSQTPSGEIINTNPSCDVTIFVKGAQNAQFSFRIFSQDFQDSEAHISGTEADIYKR